MTAGASSDTDESAEDGSGSNAESRSAVRGSPPSEETTLPTDDEGEPASDDEPRVGLYSAGRRTALLVLVVAAVAVVVAFQRLAPRERAVEVQLGRPSEVRGLELTWHAGDGEVLAAGRWAFPSGAPRRLVTRLRARDGEVKLTLTVDRGDRGTEVDVRSVGVEGESLAIDVP